MRMRVPSEGCDGGMPTPRKDSVASVMMASARLMVAMTSTGPSTLGRTCRSMMTHVGSPISLAARTYSLFDSTRVEPRTVRAYCTQNDSPIARTRTVNAESSRLRSGNSPRAVPSMRSAIRIDGKVSWMSAIRMMSVSTHPPM